MNERGDNYMYTSGGELHLIDPDPSEALNKFFDVQVQYEDLLA